MVCESDHLSRLASVAPACECTRGVVVASALGDLSANIQELCTNQNSLGVRYDMRLPIFWNYLGAMVTDNKALSMRDVVRLDLIS